MPEMGAVLKMLDFSMFLMTMILFGIVSAGIIITLFMSLYERMFEFGIMRALGTRPFHMGLLIVLEAVCLSLLSAAIGMILGALLIAFFGRVGIDYSGTEFVSLSMGVVYSRFHPRQFVLYPALIIMFTALIAIYPGLHAARMTPARAIKKEV